MIFTLTKERANDKTYGNNDVIKLCELLGFKILDEEITWGDVKAEFMGHKFSVCKQRNLNEIRISLSSYLSNQEKVRDLTEKKLENLKARLVKMVEERNASDNERNRKQSINNNLYKVGIHVGIDGFHYRDFNFSITEDKTFKSYDYLDKRLFLKLRDDVESIKSELDEILEEFKTRKVEYANALEELDKHKELILSYYEA